MWDASAAVQPEWLPVLDIPEPVHQRRLTVLLRLLLAIPQFIVLVILGIAAFVVTVLGWFGALFLGRLPGFAASYLPMYLAYNTRVDAYLMLLVDPYPPFQLESVQYPTQYPVRIELRPGALNRLAVFFRLILMIPTAIIQSVLTSGWWALSFFSWLVVLIAGRAPRPLFEATAAVLRYRMRFLAYVMMITSAYPKRIFGDPADGGTGGWEPESATQPLILSIAAKVILVIFILAGLASHIFGPMGRSQQQNTTPDTGTISVVHKLPGGP